MATSTKISGPISLNTELDLRYLKAGEHTLLIPIPDDIAELIGRIVIQWGAFELRMDIVIETIMVRLGKPEPLQWRFKSFKQRKRLFKDILTEYTKQLFPNEVRTFEGLANTAGGLHWKRNIVAHGYFGTHVRLDAEGHPMPEAEFWATGSHNGRKISIPLNHDTLLKLQHDIAHLGGNLLAAINRMGGHIISDSPEIVVPDDDFLGAQNSGKVRMIAVSEIP